jgi:HSP20 family molecular chaperone IbpA
MFELIKNHNSRDTIDSLFNNVLTHNYSDYYLSHDDEFYYLELAVPGLHKKNMDLSVNESYLFLSYNPKKDEKNTVWNDSFDKRIRLPRNIKKDSISAKLKNGILSIKIEKLDHLNHNTSIEIK